MRVVRFFLLSLFVSLSGLSHAQSASVYTWSAPGLIGGNFTSTANDCASVDAALIATLNSEIAEYSPWTMVNSACSSPASAGYAARVQGSNGQFSGSVAFVSSNAPVVPPPAIVGGSGNQYVIECVSNGGSTSVAPCNNVSSNGYSPVMFQAYVVDTSLGESFLSSVQPIDYVVCGEAFAFSFIFLMSLFVVAHPVGLVLKMIRDA